MSKSFCFLAFQRKAKKRIKLSALCVSAVNYCVFCSILDRGAEAESVL